MNRAVVLLLLTLGAFAGAVTWLHRRADPAARPKSPADAILDRKVPEFVLHDAPLQQVLRALEFHAGVPIEDGQPGEHRLETRIGRMKMSLNWRGLIIAQILDLFMLKLDIFIPEYHCDGRTIRIDFVEDIPGAWRVYDISDLIDVISGSNSAAPGSSTRRERARLFLKRSLEPLAYTDLNERRFVLSGDKLVVFLTTTGQRRLARRLDQMRQATAAVPPTAVLAALDGPVPAIPEGGLSLEQHLQAALAAKVDYRVNWQALAELGITPGMPSPHGNPETLADYLDQILKRATHDVDLEFDESVPNFAIGYRFEGTTLVIDRIENCPARVQRYARPAPEAYSSDRCNEIGYRLWRWAYDMKYFSPSLACALVDGELVVIADESFHASVRRTIAHQAR